MAISVTGSQEQRVSLATRMDTFGERLEGFGRALLTAQGTYSSAVTGFGTSATTQAAFDRAIEKTKKIQGLVRTAEDTLRRSGVQINDADDEVKSRQAAALYRF